jgi:hypothetical protein
MRPFGFDKGSLGSNMLYPSLCFLLLLLMAGSELEPPMIGSTSFVAEGVTTWSPCEAIVVVVQVSSLEVDANVGLLLLNVVNQKQGNTIVKN